MARVVVKNGHQSDTCYDEIGFLAWNKDIGLHFTLYTNGMIRCDCLKRKKNLHFDVLHLLHLNAKVDTWNNNVHDKQVLHEQNKL